MRGIFSTFLDVVSKTLVGGIFRLNLISAVDLKHSASLITSTPNSVVRFLGLYWKSQLVSIQEPIPQVAQTLWIRHAVMSRNNIVW